MKKAIIIIIIGVFFSPSILMGADKYDLIFNRFNGKPDWVLYPDNSAPAASSSSCDPGTIAYDSSYLYICTGSNTWARVAIATWAVTDKLLLSDGTSKVLLSDGTSHILIRP
jgi:hypothetical protein